MGLRRFHIRSKRPDQLINLVNAIGDYCCAKVRCYKEVIIETEDEGAGRVISNILALESRMVGSESLPASTEAVIESGHFPIKVILPEKPWLPVSSPPPRRCPVSKNQSRRLPTQEARATQEGEE